MVKNLKLRHIIAKINFLIIFQKKKKDFGENLTSGCHGNTEFFQYSKAHDSLSDSLSSSPHIELPSRLYMNESLRYYIYRELPTDDIGSFRTV